MQEAWRERHLEGVSCSTGRLSFPLSPSAADRQCVNS